MVDICQEGKKASLEVCHLLNAIPVEIRLEIYNYLLVLHLQPPQTPSLITTTSTNTPIHSFIDPTSPLLHPSILSTCRQIYHEALPTLYAQNIFLAHESNLTISPHLFLPLPPTRSRPHLITPVSVSPSILSPRPNPNIHLIRRWRIRVRLDCGFPPWPSDDVRRAFSGAEELTIYVYRAMFIGGVGVDVLRRFEGVRGVRKARILGSVLGFERYVQWLEGRMMREVEGDDEDEMEGDAWETDEERRTSKDETEGMPCENGDRVFMLGGYRCADELERKRLTGWVC
ncbi:hypothetical protein QBC37DRAFT_272667 [Rhypophila decipiens]|uniref:Uncharacterized protein n=1 Tax=Rhypophila decipiens TaxID=261697 RepID=A0AAN6YIS0_9PEZI|nr:hypothetical protein QBC37DRAFT_272667 [Rhypophila decipiens]